MQTTTHGVPSPLYGALERSGLLRDDGSPNSASIFEAVTSAVLLLDPMAKAPSERSVWGWVRGSNRPQNPVRVTAFQQATGMSTAELGAYMRGDE